jgi:uncharacterized protein YecE (DUF72 family)
VSQNLFIGQSGVKGSFPKYAQKLNFLELLAEPHRLPKLKVLAEYKKQAPEGFEFSVVLSSGALLDGGRSLFDYGLEVSRALAARWVIVRTPSSIRPSASSERLLTTLFDEVRARAKDSRIGWEPRGLWEGPARRRLADAWGVSLVTDVHDVEAASVVYARLLRVGTGARTSARLLEKLALALVQAEAGYVVVDGGPALPVRRELEEILSEALAAPDEDEDEFEGLDASGGEGAADSDGEEEDDDAEGDDAEDEGDADGEDSEGDADDEDSEDDADGEDSEDDDSEDDEGEGPPAPVRRGPRRGGR